MTPGLLALLLHYADDEAHALRALGHMAPWSVNFGGLLIADCKRALAETCTVNLEKTP